MFVDGSCSDDGAGSAKSILMPVKPPKERELRAVWAADSAWLGEWERERAAGVEKKAWGV